MGNRSRCARRPCYDSRSAPPYSGLAQRLKAQIDLYRQLADAYQCRDGARAHLVFYGLDLYRAARIVRTECAEYSRSHRRRPPNPRGVYRRTGQCFGQPRLLTNRAAYSRAHGGDRLAQTSLCGGARHSRGNRQRDVRCLTGRYDA